MLTTPDSGIESHPALKERIRVCNKLHTLLPGTNVTQLLKKASRSVTYNLSSHSALDAESILFNSGFPLSGLLKKSHGDRRDCRAFLRIARNDMETHFSSLRGAQRRSNLVFGNRPESGNDNPSIHQ